MGGSGNPMYSISAMGESGKSLYSISNIGGSEKQMYSISNNKQRTEEKSVLGKQAKAEKKRKSLKKKTLLGSLPQENEQAMPTTMPISHNHKDHIEARGLLFKTADSISDGLSNFNIAAFKTPGFQLNLRMIRNALSTFKDLLIDLDTAETKGRDGKEEVEGIHNFYIGKHYNDVDAKINTVKIEGSDDKEEVEGIENNNERADQLSPDYQQTSPPERNDFVAQPKNFNPDD